MSKSKIIIPPTVWALGFVSLFMDLSSELIHSLLPVFVVSTLGASMLTVGLIEGIAEASAHIIKVFSGAISDYFKRRKILLLLGYGLAAISKPMFPMADSVLTVFAARFLDRVGKGIRGAPRDALITDVAPTEIRGACFGLRQSLDTVGAFLGPLLAMLLLFLFHENLILVLWVAVIPAVIAFILIIVFVEEPVVNRLQQHYHSALNWHVLKRFSSHYWWVVCLGGLFTLARFSEAFLVLRALEMGLAISWIPLVMVVMSLAYAFSAYPAGVLSDYVNKKHLLAIGLSLLMLADLILAQTVSISILMVAVFLWGLHMGFSQGILATLVAEASPVELKGSGFGIFNFSSGLLMLFSSVLAGWLWQQYGSQFSFYCGAILAFLALCLLPIAATINTSDV